MVATETVEWDQFLGYYPHGDDDDRSEILRNIAFAAAEVFGKWDILYEDFVDDLQCGVSEYCFAPLEDEGFYIEDILSVTAGGKCLTRDDAHCGMGCFTYSNSDICDTTIRINPPPRVDCKKGLVVRAKLGIDLLNICSLPKCFFQKYAVHIVNYAIYKQELRRRGEKEQTSRAQIAQLREDAVSYFKDNEYNPYDGAVVSIGTSNPIKFNPC